MSKKQELFDKADSKGLIPDGVTYEEISTTGLKDLLKKDSSALVQIVPMSIGGMVIEFEKQSTIDSLITKYPHIEKDIKYIG